LCFLCLCSKQMCWEMRAVDDGNCTDPWIPLCVVLVHVIFSRWRHADQVGCRGNKSAIEDTRDRAAGISSRGPPDSQIENWRNRTGLSERRHSRSGHLI
jgi:hypothetical protein